MPGLDVLVQLATDGAGNDPMYVYHTKCRVTYPYRTGQGKECLLALFRPNGRSRYTWNDENQLIEVRFPDGEGVWYTYGAMGRRTSRTTFNAQEKGQHPTYFEYEGSSWRVVREKKKDGETTAAYTYDLRGRPLTITVDGATYWYLYNAPW